MDTIFALATARGKAGVAVVRLSGPGATLAAQALGAGEMPPRRMVRATLRRDGDVLDDALVVRFAAPASYTGEDTVELHLHGGMATVRVVLRQLGQMEGLREAEPGEFTRRALENGKLDLAAVEGLADLIDAETEAQRRAAVRQMDGVLARAAEGWRQSLLESLSFLEAAIDFPEEELPPDTVGRGARGIADLVATLQAERRGMAAAVAVRTGFEVAVVGPPNVGKSTLINMLARRDIALTSDVPGTTREVIEARIDLGGLPVTLLDTAGVRASDDRLESMGIARGIARAGEADARIVLWDGVGDPPAEGPGDIVLRARADEGCTGGIAGVSGKTGFGIEELLRRLAEMLESRCAGIGAVMHERHDRAVAVAIHHLTDALAGLKSSRDIAVVCEDVRLAARALAALTGRVDTEEVLGHIFSRFCIGK